MIILCNPNLFDHFYFHINILIYYNKQQAHFKYYMTIYWKYFGTGWFEKHQVDDQWHKPYFH